MKLVSLSWPLGGATVVLAACLFVTQPASGAPTDIAGLLHWHQASSVSGVGDGGTVSSWGNDAGCGAYCGGTLTAPTHTGGPVMAGTSDPTYNATGFNGMGAVRFNGSAPDGALGATPNNPDALLDRLEYDVQLPAGLSGFDPNYTMIIAAERAGVGDGGFGSQVAGFGHFNATGPWLQITDNVGMQHAFGGPVNATTFVADPVGVPNIYVLRKTADALPVSASNTHLSRNDSTNLVTAGFAAIPNIVVNPGTPGVQVGWNGVTGGAEWAPGDTNVAELIIYDRDLTESEMNQVGLYLAGKYGLDTGFVPEPTSIVLLGIGALGLMGFRRRASA